METLTAQEILDHEIQTDEIINGSPEVRHVALILTFKAAIENGMPVDLAEELYGVSYDQYRDYILDTDRDDYYEPFTPTVADSFEDGEAEEPLKKSLDIQPLQKKKVEFILKADKGKDYGTGKRKEQVQVQGKHGVFTRTQEVGKKNQPQPNKKPDKKDGGGEDNKATEKQKIMGKVGDLLKKIGEKISEKFKMQLQGQTVGDSAIEDVKRGANAEQAEQKMKAKKKEEEAKTKAEGKPKEGEGKGKKQVNVSKKDMAGIHAAIAGDKNPMESVVKQERAAKDKTSKETKSKADKAKKKAEFKKKAE